MRYSTKVSLTTLALGILPSLLYGAPGDFLPQSVNPSRQSPLPETMPEYNKPVPQIERQNTPQPQLDQSAKSVKFTLKKITFIGNTIYSAEDLFPLYSHMLNHEVTLEDLQNLAQAVERYYVENGYILTRVFIPPQEIDAKGEVTLEVVEGFIDKYLVDGKTKGTLFAIEQYLEEVLRDKPLRINTLERALLLINDIPGIQAKAVLTPSAVTQGASTVVVLVEQHLFDGSVTWDNRGTKYLGPEEFSVTASLDNTFNGPARATVNAKSSTQTREFTSYELEYLAFIAPSGASFDSSFTQNRTLPGNTLAPLELDGVSTSVAFIYSYPIIRSRRMNLSASLDYDYLNSDTTLLGELFTLDKLDSIRAGVNFDVQDGWDAVNLVNAQLSKGLQIFSGTAEEPIHRSRESGRKDYTKFTTTYTRIQYFSNPASIYFSMNGQYAFDSLLSPEQIGYGGAVFGSAYDPSEIVGDNGFEGKLELRYNNEAAHKLFHNLQYFYSYDWGVLWDRNKDFNTGKQSGTSSAAGIRIGIMDRIHGEIEIAKPLTKPVAAYDNNDARIFFSVSMDLSQR